MIHFDKEYGLVKFVKVNGEYRFCDNLDNHKDLLQGGETASSAGFVCYDEGKLWLMQEYSQSLKFLGPAEDDGRNIATIVGMEYAGKKDWDSSLKRQRE